MVQVRTSVVLAGGSTFLSHRGEALLSSRRMCLNGVEGLSGGWGY